MDRGILWWRRGCRFGFLGHFVSLDRVQYMITARQPGEDTIRKEASKERTSERAPCLI